MSFVLVNSYWLSIRHRVRFFGFGWFTANMAGGIIPVLFSHFIVGSETTPIKCIALVFWSLNFFLFVLFCILTVLRYLLYPSSWAEIIQHPIESLYIAAFPMALVTVINGAVAVIHNSWGFGGHSFLYTLWAFWWLDVLISFIVTFWLTHHMITRLEYRIETMSAAWMFPVVTLTVASSIGSVLSASLYPFAPADAWLTSIVSSIMLIMGLSFALKYNTLYLERLLISGLPGGLHVMSAFLPLGPLGQSGYSCLLLAEGLRSQLPLSFGDSVFLRAETTGPTLYAVCFCAGFILWAMSTAWIIFALMAVGHVVRREKVGFGPTYWGLIFPNGVYAGFNFQLGNMVDSDAFRIWGATYACGTFIMWLYIFLRVGFVFVKTELSVIGGNILSKRLASENADVELGNPDSMSRPEFA